MCSNKQTIMEYIYNIELLLLFYLYIVDISSFFLIEQMNISIIKSLTELIIGINRFSYVY